MNMLLRRANMLMHFATVPVCLRPGVRTRRRIRHKAEPPVMNFRVLRSSFRSSPHSSASRGGILELDRTSVMGGCNELSRDLVDARPEHKHLTIMKLPFESLVGICGFILAGGPRALRATETSANPRQKTHRLTLCWRGWEPTATKELSEARATVHVTSAGPGTFPPHAVLSKTPLIRGPPLCFSSWLLVRHVH